jgi:hypothetical protein
MEKGVVVLLDAIGVQEEYQREDPTTITKRWNVVDRKLSRLTNALKTKLQKSSYNPSIRIQQPYDNIQIFLPIDHPRYKDMSNRNATWWTVHHLGEILIPFFRYALYNRIYFRGCISSGEYFETRKRVFGPAINEAAEYCENANWIGIMASPNTFKVLDNPDTKDWFKIFSKYPVPLNHKEPNRTTTEREELAWVLDWTRCGRPPNYEKMVTNKVLETILNGKLIESKEIAKKHMNVGSIKQHEFKCRTKKWENTLTFYRSRVAT